MINPETIARVYDFQGLFENALKTVLAAEEIKAFTSQWIGSTGDAAADAANQAGGYELLDFQRDRPRVEILFTPGAGAGRFRPLRVNDQFVPVETSWAGHYSLRIVTTADMRLHKSFVTAVRFLMQTLPPRINAPPSLPLHILQYEVFDEGTSQITETEQGDLQTILRHRVSFSIQNDAWALFDN